MLRGKLQAERLATLDAKANRCLAPTDVHGAIHRQRFLVDS